MTQIRCQKCMASEGFIVIETDRGTKLVRCRHENQAERRMWWDDLDTDEMGLEQ
jgi:hypothetical protein